MLSLVKYDKMLLQCSNFCKVDAIAKFCKDVDLIGRCWGIDTMFVRNVVQETIQELEAKNPGVKIK